MLRKILPAAAAFMLLAGAATAQVRGVTDTEVTIGGSFPLTGQLAGSGNGHSMGIRVAIAEANAKGGIAGRQLKLILEDDAYVPARTVQNIHKLIDVDHIFALVGMSSSAGGLASLDYITQSGVINVNGYIMSTAIWETFRPTTFSVGQGYPRFVEAVIKYLDSQTPNMKWGAFVQDDAFGENIMVGVNQALAGRPDALAESIKFKRGQTDFSSEMLRMKAAGVNAIYMGGVFNEYLQIVREAKRLGMEVKFGFLFSAHSERLQTLMGEIGQGYYTADSVAALAEPAGQAFIELARKYVTPEEAKGITRDSLAGYAVGRTLIAALATCGKDLTKDCMVNALEATSKLDPGTMGPVTFGKGVRFSDQPVRVLMNDFANKRFVAVTPYQ